MTPHSTDPKKNSDSETYLESTQPISPLQGPFPVRPKPEHPMAGCPLWLAYPPDKLFGKRPSKIRTRNGATSRL